MPRFLVDQASPSSFPGNFHDGKQVRSQRARVVEYPNLFTGKSGDNQRQSQVRLNVHREGSLVQSQWNAQLCICTEVVA